MERVPIRSFLARKALINFQRTEGRQYYEMPAGKALIIFGYSLIAKLKF